MPLEKNMITGTPLRASDAHARKSAEGGLVTVRSSSSDLALSDHQQLKPATHVHGGVVALGLAAYAWFLTAAWIAFGGGYTTLDFFVIALVSVMVLGLLVGGAVRSRNMTPDRATTRTFNDFINGAVDIESGRISGRAALVQTAAMPVLLAIGGTIIAAIYIIVSG